RLDKSSREAIIEYSRSTYATPRSEVEKDAVDGAAAGVTGTPTTFINGIKVVGAQPYSVFKQVIDAELKK
ncbi:MAG: DSBA oxidoreductase, partial [Candidatus Yanofskybacteria bacterium GW2011_GWA2_44_9]